MGKPNERIFLADDTNSNKSASTPEWNYPGRGRGGGVGGGSSADGSSGDGNDKGSKINGIWLVALEDGSSPISCGLHGNFTRSGAMHIGLCGT